MVYKRGIILTDGSKSININPWDVDSMAGWVSLSGDDIDENNPEASYFRRVPWLYRGTKDRANNVSHMPFVIKDGETEIDNSQEYKNALEWFANPTSLFHKLEMSLVMTGRAYAKLEVNKSGYIQSIKYLVPTSITEHYDDLGVVDYYERKIKGHKYQILPNEIIAIYDPDYMTENGPGGASAAIAALNAAGVLYNSDKFVSNFFAHGAIKASILSTETQDKLEAEKLQHWWDRVMGGVDHAWTKYVLRGKKVEVTTIGEGLESLTNESLSTERRQDIATALGVPESRMWSAAANYATRVQDDKAYFDGTIVPDCELIAEAFDEQAFSAEHNLENTQIQFMPETLDVFQTGALEQFQAVKAATDAGFPLLMASDLVGVELSDAQRTELEAKDAAKVEAAAKLAENLANASKQAPQNVPQEGTTTTNQGQADNLHANQPPMAKAVIQVSPDKSNAFSLWQRKAIKRLKESGSAVCEFVSDAIDQGENERIQTALIDCKTPDDVKAIFTQPDVYVDKGGESILAQKLDDAIQWLREDDAKKAVVPVIQPYQQPIMVINAADQFEKMIAQYTQGTQNDITQYRQQTEADMKDVEAVLKALTDATVALVQNASKSIVVNVPEQQAPVVNVAAPVVNVPAPQITVEAAQPSPVNLSITRNKDGKITGIKE